MTVGKDRSNGAHRSASNEAQLPSAKAVAAGELDWLEPEIRGTPIALDADVRRLIAVKAREENR